MTTKNQTRRIIQRLRYVFPFVLVVVGILALTGGVTRVFQQNANHSSSTLTSTLPHASYTSDKLGISFSYIPFFPNGIGQYFYTKEIGDKVFLYWVPGANHPFSGSDAEFLQKIAPGAYSVEVFTKDSHQSLADAIKQQFLTGIAGTDCYVNSTRDGHPRQDESFQTAIIDFPHHSNQSRKQLEVIAAKCPYVRSFTGVNYFMMDQKQTSKLLFVNLGQDDIPSGINGYTWDETIKVY